MRVVRFSVDRMDTRRDRRYLTPVFEVTVEGQRFRSVNWSMGGILLDGACQGAAIGSLVGGSLGLPGAQRALCFSAEIVRTDPETGASALRFEDIGEDGVEFLDRALAHRLH